MAIQKHIGVNHLGSRVAVVNMHIPNTDDALVVETESLPPRYIDSFADLVTRNAQQTTESLDSLLHRNRFPSGENMLQALHENGFLRKINIDQITMLVDTNGTRMPLRAIVDAIENGKDGLKVESVKSTQENQDTQSTPPLDALMADITDQVPETDQAAPTHSMDDLYTAINSLTEHVKTLENKVDELSKPKKRGRPPKSKEGARD